jgi:hypothetical protein
MGLSLDFQELYSYLFYAPRIQHDILLAGPVLLHKPYLGRKITSPSYRIVMKNASFPVEVLHHV